jgi:putative nucleotidyltransferase with HDIG domain
MAVSWQAKETTNLPWAQLRLPPFSQVALRVLQLASTENLQLHELSDLISSDPALASEVLSIVNSLAYSPRFPITSILQAIAVMGANHLQGLCLTVGVRGYMGESLGHPAMQALWRHNLACAAIAEQLAAGTFIDRDTAFTCGVIHDIGRLALAAIRPKDYLALLSTHAGPPRSILECERELFGKDHCEIGRQLVVQWKLPEDFDAIVAEHHKERAMDGPWDMPDLINFSCRMAETAGFPAFHFCQTEPFEELREQLPPHERRLFHADVGTLIFDIQKKISAIESI